MAPTREKYSGLRVQIPPPWELYAVASTKLSSQCASSVTEFCVTFPLVCDTTGYLNCLL